MNFNDQSSVILLICFILPVVTALVVLAWGRRIARQGDWLIAIALLVAAIGIALSFAGLHDQAIHLKTWTRGWIWPRAEAGSITIGVIEDSLGLAMAALSLTVAAVFLSNRAYLSQEPRAERVYAGLAFSACGVSIAWVALTPWMAFMGLMLTGFGGFVALGSRWNGEVESEVASRFAWERATGIILTLIGACGLAVGRTGLSWLDPASMQGPIQGFADHFGAALLLIGLFFHFQPFPLLGGLVKATEAPTSVRAIQTQLFPAWAALAILFRFEPHLRAMEILPFFGWAQLLAAALALGMGYSQQNWRTSFGAWVSAGTSVCAAILALSGPIQGVTLWIGFVLGAATLALSASTLATGGKQSASHKTRAIWTKLSAFVGVCAATGMVGFVSAGSVVHSVSALWEQPGEWISILGVYFLFVVLGWKQVWSLGRSRNTVQLPWTTVLAPIVLGLLGLGVWWTGTLTGGVLAGNPDQVFHPAVSSFFPAAKLSLGEEAQFGAASGALWGCSVLALFLGYLWAAKGPWKPVSVGATKVLSFVASGYGIDSAMTRIFGGVRAFGELTERWIDREIWWNWMPEILVRAVRGLSRGAVMVDQAATGRLDSFVRQGIDVPAKVLQLLQNGNVQWYLFFAMAVGMAILIHFLRV